MTLRNRTVKLVPILLLAAATGTAAQGRKEVSADSYDVYSALLTQQHRSWFSQKEPVLIVSRTVLEPQGHSGGGCRAKAERDPILKNLIDKLLAEKQEFRIGAKLQLPGPYKILTGKAQISDNRQPGIVSLSAVEFSEDHSKAVALVAHSCGLLCGDGIVWVLEKSSSGWRTTKDQLNCGWIR